jgi:hypothetical protein
MRKRYQQHTLQVAVVTPRMIKAGATVLANRGDLDDNAIVAVIYRSMVNEAARSDVERAALPPHLVRRSGDND